MNLERATIVVVDDDREMAAVLCDVLRSAGYNSTGANSGTEALKLVKQTEPDVLISDLRMSGMNGHQLQLELKRVAPYLPVVMITAFGSIQTAVESMKLGAFDYITKPFGNDELLISVARALESRRLHQEVQRLRGELARSNGLPNIIAANPKMLALLEIIGRIADSPANVLITGESGTGKELLARALHFESQRRDGPLVPVNCAALPEHLIESELFGHVKGAFTDAHQNKTGLFVAASGGTLFLDEIGELPLPLQPKLLRVIEDKKVRPVGARVEVPVDVRLVSATNAELEKAIAAGTFRSDLYYRLATVSLTVPPLRARPDDIPLLVRHFLVRTSAGVGKPVPELAPEAMSRMTTYQWPGNVRELHAAIQRGVILCRNNRLTLDDLPPTMLGADAQLVKILDAAVERRLTLDQLDREYVRAMLESVGGNKTQAASILQIDRKTLYRKLEEPEPAEPDSPD